MKYVNFEKGEVVNFIGLTIQNHGTEKETLGLCPVHLPVLHFEYPLVTIGPDEFGNTYSACPEQVVFADPGTNERREAAEEKKQFELLLVEIDQQLAMIQFESRTSRFNQKGNA